MNQQEGTSQDDLVTVKRARNEFEAGLMVAALQDEGVEAVAFGMHRNFLPLDTRFTGVPVQVRASDLELARMVLEQRALQPADVNWEEVDVGEREDEVPLRPTGRLPWPARIARAVAMLLALIVLIGLIAMMIW